ncbi:hypothetical protein HZH66_001257 [Vespula vulgaris]|uniref:Uncharacterized protein n=1 Tax=Vespula vulgaris TaxID=7454 RepID=A0A834KUP8_VESVU|nr:hypothetical protein HZH66_001257 [Vespula vulgaris]
MPRSLVEVETWKSRIYAFLQWKEVAEQQRKLPRIIFHVRHENAQCTSGARYLLSRNVPSDSSVPSIKRKEYRVPRTLILDAGQKFRDCWPTPRLLPSAVEPSTD